MQSATRQLVSAALYRRSDAKHFSTRFALIAAASFAFSGVVSAAPALPVIPNGIFNVTSYGAVGNGSNTDTAAIQNAINAASAAGGGTVLIPDSGTGVFMAGALSLSSNINLDIASGATLEMLAKGQYTSGSRPFISANNISNACIWRSVLILFTFMVMPLTTAVF